MSCIVEIPRTLDGNVEVLRASNLLIKSHPETARLFPLVRLAVIVDGIRRPLDVHVSDSMSEDQVALLAYLHDYAERYDFS